MKTFDTFHVLSKVSGALPEQVDCSHEIVKTQDGLLLAVSSIAASQSAQWSTPGERGLSIGIVQGRMRFDLAGRWHNPFDGQFGYCLATSEQLVTQHAMQAHDELLGISVNASPAALDALELRCGSIGGRSSLRLHEFMETDFRQWRPDTATMGIVHDMTNCAYQGALRTLFLEAKTLELLVRVMGATSGMMSESEGARLLSARDRKRFMHARDILLASLSSPPTLAQLAREVGISTSGLTAGFRQVFSMSVVEFIQKERLARAVELIRDGHISIAEAAYQVGYSPAHFSTLFRRQYGYAPSTLARASR